MGEDGGLEASVKNQWIPDNLFMGRDLIPAGGMGTSLVRVIKITIEGDNSPYHCQWGLRMLVFGAVCVYNAALLAGGALVYNGMTG